MMAEEQGEEEEEKKTLPTRFEGRSRIEWMLGEERVLRGTV